MNNRPQARTKSQWQMSQGSRELTNANNNIFYIARSLCGVIPQSHHARPLCATWTARQPSPKSRAELILYVAKSSFHPSLEGHDTWYIRRELAGSAHSASPTSTGSVLSCILRAATQPSADPSAVPTAVPCDPGLSHSRQPPVDLAGRWADVCTNAGARKLGTNLAFGVQHRQRRGGAIC